MEYHENGESRGKKIPDVACRSTPVEDAAMIWLAERLGIGAATVKTLETTIEGAAKA